MVCTPAINVASDIVTTPLGNKVIITHYEGAKVEIVGDAKASYEISFIDSDTQTLVYKMNLTPGHWAMPRSLFFVKWQITVKENDTLICDTVLNLKNRKVWIGINSQSLGDTVAWIPYAEEFRKKHQCEVHVGTFYPEMFKGAYPELFIEPMSADDRNKYFAAYKLGAFDNDYHRHKKNWRVIPLQQMASDYLGLEYKEIRPKVTQPSRSRPIPEKYVCISEFSTLQGKFWNYPNGWQEIVDYLNSRGLKVISISKELTSLNNLIRMNGLSIEDTMSVLREAEFCITVSSGLCWLAWALGITPIIVSGITKAYTEMKDCLRVINTDVCHGCYNDPYYPFDRGNWNWCPRNKKFECTTSITPDMVKEKIDIALGTPRKESKHKEVRSKYKVKLVHLLSRPNEPTERRSIASLSELQKFGVEYVQHVNGYETRLPNLEPKYPTGQWGQPLRPGYYGVWKANKRAVEEEFGDDIDFLMICERDTVLNIPADVFCEKMNRCFDQVLERGVDYFSFGYKDCFSTGYPQSLEVEPINDEMYFTNKIIGLHCIAFPQRTKSFLLDSFKNVKWYAADIWYNEVFHDAGKNIAIVRDRCIDQEDDGVSLIDSDLNKLKPQVKEGKVLFFAPHCSTGGMPQYMYRCVKELVSSGVDVKVVEYEDIAPCYAVQKNRIKELCDLLTLGEDKLGDLQKIVKEFSPDVIHLQEVPEMWLLPEMAKWLYSADRTYKIVETSHSSAFDPKEKTCMPDKFALVSEYHMRQYAGLGVPCELVEYQAEIHVRPDRTTALRQLGLDPNKKHVLNVGLFAPWKNQGDIFSVARQLPDVEFHFVGNQAPNFQDYWGPLMNNKPANCRVWGERSDVDAFYGAMDLFIFSSKWECFPLVLKEAIAWGMPVLMRNLDTYCGAYDGKPDVEFIGDDIDTIVTKIRQRFKPSMVDGLLKTYGSFKKAKLGIVILSKYEEHLHALMSNISKHEPHWQETCKIVVGNDGLSLECIDMYTQLGVTILNMEKPFNFARNINACVRALDKDSDILLLNDDITFDTDNFSSKIRELLRRGDTDTSGSKYGAIALALTNGEVGNAMQKYGAVEEKEPIRSLGYICFVAVAISRETWNKAGEMDERFVGYGCEDIDWCRRAKDAGYGLGVTPLVTIQHGFDDSPASSSFVKAFGVEKSREMFFKSKDEYVKKWGSYDWWG